MNSILSKDVIKEWGLSSMKATEQSAMVERIGRILYQAILVRALDILSEKEQIEFDELLDLDSTTPDDVLAFLQKRIPTFDKMVEDEKKSLKEDILIPAR
jgi:hypothetical protein